LINALLSACTATTPSGTPDKAPEKGDPTVQENSAESLSASATPENAKLEQRQATGRLIIHVGKTGRLARLGHNHLVSSEKLEGEAWLAANSELNASVQVAVEHLEVDKPELRESFRNAVNGWPGTYDSTPSAKNRTDTRANMLGPRVLDAKNHPVISAQLVAPEAAQEFAATTAGSLNATLTVEIRAMRTQLPVTLQWQRTPAEQIEWRCTFKTTHNALGLTPFSALGGALAVAEDLTIEVSGLLHRSGSVQTSGTTLRNH